MTDKNEPREITFEDTFFKLENFTINPELVLALHKNSKNSLEVYTQLSDKPIRVVTDAELQDITKQLAQASYDRTVYTNAVFKAFHDANEPVTDSD